MNTFFQNNKKEIISVLILVILLPLLLLAGLSKTINQVFAEIYDILFVIGISLVFAYGVFEIFKFVLEPNKEEMRKNITMTNFKWITFISFTFVYWSFFVSIALFIVVQYFNLNTSYTMDSDLFIIVIPIFLFIISNIFLTIDSNVSIKDQLVLSVVSLMLMLFFIAFVYLLIVYSFALLFLILIATSFNDMSAYFFGKRWGNKKLSPEISPNKTVFGFTAGITISLVFGIIWYLIFIMPDYSINYMTSLTVWKSLFIIFLIAFASPIGDLFFSKIKRSYDKKDYGNLIPEHGGLLDRIDSHIFTTTIAFMIVLM